MPPLKPTPLDQIEKLLRVAYDALFSEEQAGPGNSHFDSGHRMVWLTEKDAETLGMHVWWERYSDWLMQKDWTPEKEIAAKGPMTCDELAEYVPLVSEQLKWATMLSTTCELSKGRNYWKTLASPGFSRRHVAERERELVKFQKEQKAPFSLGLFVSILRGTLEGAGVDLEIEPEFLWLYEFGLWPDGGSTSRRPKTEHVLKNLCRAISSARDQIRAAVPVAPGGSGATAEGSYKAEDWDKPDLPSNLRLLAQALIEVGGKKVKTKWLCNKVNGEPSKIIGTHRKSKWRAWITDHIGHERGLYWWKRDKGK